MSVRDEVVRAAQSARGASRRLGTISAEQRAAALNAMAQALRENAASIIAANAGLELPVFFGDRVRHSSDSDCGPCILFRAEDIAQPGLSPGRAQPCFSGNCRRGF